MWSFTCRVCAGRVKRNFWILHERTAEHVVYNTEETVKTRVNLFCDDERSVETRKVASTWHHMGHIVRPWLNSDFSVMMSLTHDKRAGQRFENLHDHWMSLMNDVQYSSIISNKPGLDLTGHPRFS